jgi:hypothetical protein
VLAQKLEPNQHYHPDSCLRQNHLPIPKEERYQLHAYQTHLRQIPCR